MKKLFFLLLFAGILLSACSNNGRKVEAQDAKKVGVTQNDQTATFATVNAESHVKWKASHLGGVQPRFGKISLKSAEFLVNGGQLTNATVVIDMGAITVESFPEGSTDIAKLTGHLQSDDFFNIEKFPVATFELTKQETQSGNYNTKVTGNLTILDVTKSISFNANINTSVDKVSIKSEDFSVDRTDWGLVYNTEGTAGVPTNYLIANNIGFTIDVSVKK